MSDDVTLPDSQESPRDYGEDPAGLQARWESELRLSNKECKDFLTRCRKIKRRYRGDEGVAVGGDERNVPQGMQILWSTIQTQIPAVFQFPPDVEVSRRFRTKAPVARVAALILERYLEVEKDRDDFSAEIMAVLTDRLLTSLGQMWVEYEPVVEQIPQQVSVLPGEKPGEYVTSGGEPYTGEEPSPAGPDGSMMGMQPMDKIVDCRAPAIHLAVEDFRHSPARVWREVRWVARRQFFTRDEIAEHFQAGQEQFKWDVNSVPLNFKAKMDGDEEERSQNLFKRAEVWQIWDDFKVHYIVFGMGVPLQIDERPLILKSSRWPCPRPYYGTMTADTLVPVPDFTQWQDLADEIDELTARIRALTTAVKLVGARPADIPELDKVLKANDNSLVPVENWAMFKGEKGGIENMISWLPMVQVMEVLVQLQAQRKERIDYAYQINGVGDILRGQGDPRATATAEEIKENYGSLRLRQMQQDLGSFCERVLQIKAEIICEKAPPEVLVEVSGIEEVQADAQHIQPAVQMLKDHRVRDLRIDVDETSMVAMQDQKEKQSRMEFVGAMEPMISRVIEASQAAPQVLDVAAEVMLFAARGFRVGRDFEGTLEQFSDASRQQAAKAREEAKKNPPPPPPQVMVENLKAQNAEKADTRQHQMKMQQIDAEAEADRQAEVSQAQSEGAIESMRAENDMKLADKEAANEERIARLEANLKILTDRAAAQEKARNDRIMAQQQAAADRQMASDNAQHTRGNEFVKAKMRPPPKPPGPNGGSAR